MNPKSKKRNAQAKKTQNVRGASSPEQFHQLMGLFETVQEHEEQHQNCVKDALDIYREMSHDEFMDIISFGIRKWMGVESFDNTYAQTGLRFLARLAVSNHANDSDNKIVKSISEFLLERTSPKVVIRQYICYLIYYLVRYANILKVPIDIDSIVSHVLVFLHDKLSAVREQAATVLLLFQDRPEVLEALLEHLSRDPSTAVRHLIIKSIKFTSETIPHILERLQDTNELIRCELYTDLIERDVTTLTIEQRCQILNSGYNDQSARVQTVIADGLISSWLRRYNNCYLSLLKAIKFDANEQDVQRFIRLSKYILFNLFKKFTRDGHVERLCEQLGLKTEGEFINCMPFDRLSLEMAIFWWLLIQFGRRDNEDSVEQILCNVDTFCKYIQEFLLSIKTDWMQNGFKVQILIDILRELDVDEFGRKSLSDFVANTLMNETKLLNETAILSLVKCAEKSVQNNKRGQYFANILQGICDRVPSIDRKINELISLVRGDDVKLRITQLKSQILELKEEEISLMDENNFKHLREIRCQIKQLNMQIIDICRDFGAYDQEKDIDISAYELSAEEIIKCLQIFFYSCHSIESPSEIALFYGSFVYQQLDAENVDVRGWALKCNASLSLRFNCALYEGIDACYKQFVLNGEPRLWSISVTAICELLDKHQVEIQVPSLMPDANNSVKLVNITDMLFDMLKQMKQEEIKNSLIIGLCRLILSGAINDKEKIAYMLVEFFNPDTDPSSQQILGQFIKKLTDLKCQSRLISALVPAFQLLSQSQHQIKFKQIISFLIAITIPELPHVTSMWHNQIAIELTKLMLLECGSQQINVISEQINALKIHIKDDFKQQIRPILSELLGKLSGQPKQNVKTFWKKLGFKNSDRNVTQIILQSSSTPSTTFNSMIYHDASSRNGSARERTNTTKTSTRRSESNRKSSISIQSNDENEQRVTNSKRNQTQRADTDPIRKAFGNRANV